MSSPASSPKRLRVEQEKQSESEQFPEPLSDSGKTESVSGDTAASGSVKSMALSMVSISAGERILEKSFSKLDRASLPLSEIIDLRPVPNRLKRDIFPDLARHVKTCRFPRLDQKEDLKSFILMPMLQRIVSSLMHTYELTTDDLYIDTQADFEIVVKRQTYKGKSDISVMKEIGFPKFNFYLSVECKKDDIKRAIFRCIMYLKRMYEIETNKEVIFQLFFRGFWVETIFQFELDPQSLTLSISLPISSATMACVSMEHAGSSSA